MPAAPAPAPRSRWHLLLAALPALAVVLVAQAVPTSAAPRCTATVGPRPGVRAAIARARDGARICLRPGSYGVLRLTGTSHRRAVTITRAPGTDRADVRVAGVHLQAVSGLRVDGLTLTGRVSVLESGSRLRITGNDIVGPRDGGGATAGVYLYGWVRRPQGTVSDVLIAGNDIHGMDWPEGATAGPGDGYGIVMAGHHHDITVRGNTIRDIAVDSIQSSGGDRLVVDGNTFTGPGHSARHPGVHADLWQVFGDAHGLRFTDNVVRGTGTDESLLFQSGHLDDVVVQDNLFDHDSTGYAIQIYPARGLVLRRNTAIGSRWGVVLRDAAAGTYPSGRRYLVERNAVDAAEGAALTLEPGVAGWGVFDWNAVSGDSPAAGPNGLTGWTAGMDLPFAAGRPAQR